MATRIGVDVGGTFTDLIGYDDRSGEVSVEKVPSTPLASEHRCIGAIRRPVERGAELGSCDYFLHGTTVGLNALLERRGAIVGLLCTEGFRDTPEIRRGGRPEQCDLTRVPPEPLVHRHLRQPVAERVDANGIVVRPLVRQTVVNAVKVLKEHGVRSAAVCFINAYANPTHELEAAVTLREAGFEGDLVVGGDLRNRLLAQDRLQRHLRLQLR